MTAPVHESPDSATTTRADALPELRAYRRPRLRREVPILWRSASAVQIGDDITLTSVTRSEVAWLTALDGLTSPAAIAESLTIPAEQAARLVRALVAAGALDDASRVPENVRWAGPLARDDAQRRFSSALAAYRDLDLAHTVTTRRERQRIAVAGTGRLAEEIRSALAAAGLADVSDHADIVVLADTAHPHVPASFDDPRMTRPHIHVGAFGDHATAGPLVVPGRTSCLRCQHLHRRDADPSWPVLSVQWAHWAGTLPGPPVDPLLHRLAADWATMLVRAWVDLPDEPAVWADTAVDLHLPLGIPRMRNCPPHPLCGCRWINP